VKKKLEMWPTRWGLEGGLKLRLEDMDHCKCCYWLPGEGERDLQVPVGDLCVCPYILPNSGLVLWK
jgi:hypothetical protein